MAVWTCMREYGGEVAFSVGQPCPPKMTILRLCHCIGVVRISSFVLCGLRRPLRRRAPRLRLRHRRGGTTADGRSRIVSLQACFTCLTLFL